MKQCTRCKEWKDESEFNWRWQERGILQSVCRDCQHGQSRDHYETHKESVKAKAAKTKRKARQEAEQFVYNFLSYSKCADCGEYDFAVLTFDHVRGKKRMDISRMVAEGYSIDAIREEIYKCDVVCANCHMRRENKSPNLPLRRTDQALLQLIDSSTTHLLIVSFAVYKIEGIVRALNRAARRGVKIDICLETPDTSEGKITFDTIRSLGNDLVRQTRVYIWPLEKRPTSADGRHGSLQPRSRLEIVNGCLSPVPT